MEKPKHLDPEEERRRRERKHREREGRHRDGKHRSSRRSPNYKLDVIDKLDVTSIYGTGCKCGHRFPCPPPLTFSIFQCSITTGPSMRAIPTVIAKVPKRHRCRRFRKTPRTWPLAASGRITRRWIWPCFTATHPKATWITRLVGGRPKRWLLTRPRESNPFMVRRVWVSAPVRSWRARRRAAPPSSDVRARTKRRWRRTAGCNARRV